MLLCRAQVSYSFTDGVSVTPQLCNHMHDNEKFAAKQGSPQPEALDSRSAGRSEGLPTPSDSYASDSQTSKSVSPNMSRAA